ncbi:hypothetical protein C8J57DRAFT_1570062 [Mycena rebaudengoi]|nr:hypothetical protein C8J57DRAFT_1570062 [Mycena rebaudengoi]
MPPLPVISLTFVLGGWDLGTQADLILQGILFAQFTNYWSQYYKSDSLSLKLFVLGLLLSTTLKSAHAIALVWVQNVEYFMDLQQAAGLFFTHWLYESNVLIGAIIGFSVQAFFCRRLWIISNNIYVVAFVVLLFVLSLIAVIAYTAFEFSGQLLSGNSFQLTDKKVWGQIHLATVLAGDVILSGSTIYFLLKRARGETKGETMGILHRLTRLVFQAAVPVTLCTLAKFICQFHYNHGSQLDPAPMDLIVTVTTLILPKLYAISAMWTLNSRQEMRFTTYVSSISEDSTVAK